MGLQQTLRRVSSDYGSATREPFKGHPLASFLRDDAAEAVRSALGAQAKQFKVVGSPGKGNWADVSWISVFDPVVTDTATSGYYVVYLFNSRDKTVTLSLNQGTTAVREEFKAAAPEVLKTRANFMRLRLPEYVERFPTQTIVLGSTRQLPRDYEAGHALGVTYDANNLPRDDELRTDLQAMATAYLVLTSKGGLEQPLDESDRESIEQERPQAKTIEEQRQYRTHRKIERRSGVAKKVKALRGYACEACGFEFERTYGELGEGYIEAHHLRPLASLNVGEAVTYDLETDFCVLCANCHRMIHRQDDPADLSGLRRRLGMLLGDGDT